VAFAGAAVSNVSYAAGKITVTLKDETAAGAANLNEATGAGNTTFTNSVRAALPAITNSEPYTLGSLTNNARPVWIVRVPQAATLRSFRCQVNEGAVTGNVTLVWRNETNLPTVWKTIDGKRALNNVGVSDTSFGTSALPAGQMVGVLLSQLSSFHWTNSAVFTPVYTIP
jgi:hypothetical protein